VAAYFFDSSAIVKRYLTETGTTWVSRITDLASGNKVYLVRIAFVEVISAIARRSGGPGLSTSAASKAIADFRDDFANEYSVIETTPTLIESAADYAETYLMRAYDAVQLAAVLQLNTEATSLGLASIILISADGALNTAAVAEGLAVDDLNLHP